MPYKNHLYLIREKKKNTGICEKARRNSLKQIPRFLRENICHASFHRQDRFTYKHVLTFTLRFTSHDAFQREQHQKAFVTVSEIYRSLFAALAFRFRIVKHFSIARPRI